MATSTLKQKDIKVGLRVMVWIYPVSSKLKRANNIGSPGIITKVISARTVVVKDPRISTAKNNYSTNKQEGYEVNVNCLTRLNGPYSLYTILEMAKELQALYMGGEKSKKPFGLSLGEYVQRRLNEEKI